MPEYIRRPYKVHAEKTKKPKVIHTLEGDMKAKPGDMIVTGRRGEKWPVKPGIFQESYRPAENGKVAKKVEVLRLRELKENPLNRDIDRDKVDKIKRAIIRTGVIKPLVYTEIMTDDGKENMLTDGHHRYVALKEMGYKRVPAVMADERGVDTANEAEPEKVKKHLPGQHDQRSHTPKTRRAREAVAGTAEAGAVHLATIVIPAAVVGGLIRLAPRIGLGVIGVAAAFVLYEVPQLIFRMVEGGYRGYAGERPYRLEPKKKMMKVGNRDIAGRTISRGDHALVMYQGQANVGVHLGGDVTRLLQGEKLIDVETNETNRMKIATGEEVPSSRPDEAEKTKRVLNQLIQEQKILLNLAHTLKQRQSVKKHTPGGKQHDQSDHAPEPKARRGKVPGEGKKLRAQFRPAIRSPKGRVYAGRKGETHGDVFTRHGENLDPIEEIVDGFVDEEGNFLTRQEALRRAGISTAEELREGTKKKTEKRIDILRNLIVEIENLVKAGILSTPVRGLGLVREDLGICRKKKRRSEKGWTTGRTIQLRRPVKNPEGHEIEGSRFP